MAIVQRTVLICGLILVLFVALVTLLVVLRPMVLRITSVVPAGFGGGGSAMAALAGPAGSALPGPTTQAMAAAS